MTKFASPKQNLLKRYFHSNECHVAVTRPIGTLHL